MKIYVASSWRNELQPAVVNTLREAGHEVYDFRNPSEGDYGFAWSDIDKNWQDWTSEKYVEALKHPLAEAGFKSDFDAMKWADCCVMVLPCGRSANTEAGWMKGNGKKVFIYQPMKQEPELMYKIYDGIITSLNELRQFATNEINVIKTDVDNEPSAADKRYSEAKVYLHSNGIDINSRADDHYRHAIKIASGIKTKEEKL